VAANWTGGNKHRLDIRVQLRLIALHGHHVVAAARHDRRGYRALGEQRIHGEDAALQQQPGQEGLGTGDLIGLVAHVRLAQREAQPLAHRAEPVRPRHAALPTPRSGLPSMATASGSAAPPGGACRTASAQAPKYRFDLRPVQRPKHRVERRGARRGSVGEAQRPRPRAPIVACPLRDSPVALIAAEHRGTC
jgi:hypothetical protein